MTSQCAKILNTAGYSTTTTNFDPITDRISKFEVNNLIHRLDLWVQVVENHVLTSYKLPSTSLYILHIIYMAKLFKFHIPVYSIIWYNQHIFFIFIAVSISLRYLASKPIVLLSGLLFILQLINEPPIIPIHFPRLLFLSQIFRLLKFLMLRCYTNPSTLSTTSFPRKFACCCSDSFFVWERLIFEFSFQFAI